MTNSEFWRELKPIEQKFRPGALPEAYIANAPTEDDRFYAPLSETVGTRPLWISPSQNRWCDVLMCRGAGLVNRHYHPQQVFAYTISGKWGYLEHDWIATAGDWVYEAPGESHTLIAYECDEPMRVTFNVTGPLIWLDENGEPNGTFDVFDYIALVRDHYEKNGIGADYIDGLFRLVRCSLDANRLSPSVLDRCRAASCPRTLFPAWSRSGENVPRPPLPGDTATVPPAIPLFPGTPTSKSQSPEVSYIPAVAMTASACWQTSGVTT